jgi:hypothetical protein
MTEPVNLRNYQAIDFARDLMEQVNAFLREHPVIQSEDEYREGAKLATLANKCLADADAERKTELAPHALEVGKINHRYKERTEPLRELLKVLDQRDTAFAREEEQRRAAEAAEKRRLADEAIAKAQEAEATAIEAISDAESGVVGVDMASVGKEHRGAILEAAQRLREAERAERDLTFRVRTAPGERAVSMRNKEVLTLTDPVACITAMGLTEDVREAILSDARKWRKLKGALPPGVVSTINRSL